VRNIRPSFYKGRTWGMLYSALSTYVFRGKEPWTFSLREDHMQLKPAKDCTVIEYPKPDHQLTYPLLTMLKMTGTRHEENQPCHLQIQNQKNVYEVNVPLYDFPEGRYCPANVYELVDGVLQINASNCIHCKTCDIKDPGQNIRWVPPQGGEGPSYQIT
jgi:electron-transferring-flavoprotein dehydrogenase